MMRNEFVPYNESLELKALGFDELCVYYVDKDNNSYIYNFQTHPDEFIEGCGVNVIPTPTFSQAFRWFREKYDMHYQLIPFYSDEEGPAVDYYLAQAHQLPPVKVKTYEEAELECLRKLIEIVKKNQK